MLHHNFPRGTRILIIFRDGTKLDCKFLDRKAKSMITDKGEFPFKSMRATTIYKHRDGTPDARNTTDTDAQ
ncbi:MAG: hypothetical protein FWE38_04705 [Firmicutes bacterium]|nr:hypothetical protein [Bacillota bacterium]